MNAKDERQYPEHLNPFHKTRNGLSQSFRGLKKSLFGSFRRKSKDARPEIRKHTETLPQSRHTVSVIPRVQINEYTPLPRSRFSERLTKSPSPHPKPRQWHSNESVAKNPFDDEETKQEKPNETSNTTETPPIPAERKKFKKRKKRAPIPPNGVQDSNYLNVPSNMSNSKWSLTSTDTEFSSTCYSENEIDYTYAELTKTEEILQITKEIEKFTDDSNNNFIINNTMEVSDSGDNYVITQTKETVVKMEITGFNSPNVESSVQITEINEADSAPTGEETCNKMEGKINEDSVLGTVTEEICNEMEQSPHPITDESVVEIVEINEEFKNDPKEETIEDGTRTENKDIEVLEPTETVTFNDRSGSESANEELSSNIHSVSLDEVKDIDVDFQNNNVDVQSEQNVEITKCENFPLTYSQSKTIFINGSRVDLDQNHLLYNERTSLFITGSTDELEKSHIDNTFKEKIQYFEDRSPTKHEHSPISKVRKSILSKEKLLGSDST